MAASNLTTMARIYKRVYSDEQVANMAQRDHPFMSHCAKKGKFTGTRFDYNMQYGNPQGVSSSFADAQGAVSSSQGSVLNVLRKVKYGVITLDGEAVAASEDDKGAFMSLVTNETDGIINEVGDSMAFDFQRAGNGDRGRRASASSNVITLTSEDDVRNFKRQMVVVAGPNQNGTSLRTGSTTVAAVNASALTITLADASAITSFADNDYLFRIGDPGNVSDGLESLFPLVAPVYLSDSFRGIDRGVHPDLLAGIRIDDTASTIEENAGLVATMIASQGQKADCVYLNPIRFWEVSRRQNAKVMFEKAGGSTDYGFEYITIHTGAGVLKVYSDPDVPQNRGRVLNKKSNYIKHLKGFIHVIMDDGRPNLRQPTADGIEARIRSWHNILSTNPGANGVFSIS